jgi:ABC-type multidrug transport system permease subunit
MLRAALLIFENEFRLLARDKVGLFMLLLAPVVIIAVAGFSLGSLYGPRTGTHEYLVAVVNDDHGTVGATTIDALRREPSLTVSVVPSLVAARRIVLGGDRAALAVAVPAGTTDGLAAGHPVHLVVYVDPVKRLEAGAIELRLGELCRGITARAQDESRRRIADEAAALHARIDELSQRMTMLSAQIKDYRSRLSTIRAATRKAIEAQVSQSLDQFRVETRRAIERSMAQARSSLERDLAARREALLAVNRYLTALQSTGSEFEHWFAELKKAAGSHAADIPSPPQWPPPPPKEQLAKLASPLPIAMPSAPTNLSMPQLANIRIPALPSLPSFEPASAIDLLRQTRVPQLPGNLGLSERSLTGGKTEVNSFDQYVPGFGITFLLIGMLMGIALGLIDDRDWGTLERLRVSGAPLAGTLIGKLLSRFVVGLMQLVVLFVVGWLLFGVSLGQHPVALLLPAAAMSFAAAAFGLLVACVARTHDSVMPLGAVTSMAMSAVGGCWWPLDFEPSWMRELALWLPTTWAMRAFNDLMIRNLSAASALRPAAAIVGLGAIFLIAGLMGASRIYE